MLDCAAYMFLLIVLGLALAILPIIGAVKGQAYRGAYLATSIVFGAVGWFAFFLAAPASPAALATIDPATRAGMEAIDAYAMPVAAACWLIAFGCLVATAAYRKPAHRPASPRRGSIPTIHATPRRKPKTLSWD